MIQAIREFLMPWERLDRIQRELNAKEKAAYVPMLLEWIEFQNKVLLEWCDKPLLCKQFLNDNG